MSSPGTVPVREPLPEEQKSDALDPSLLMQPGETQQSLLPYLRLFWKCRRFLLCMGVCAMLASALIAILIPVRYQSVTRLMPPDGQSSSGLGLLSIGSNS